MVDEFDDRVLIGEIYLPFERLVAYYGKDLVRRASAVQFRADVGALECARRSPKMIDAYEAALPPGAWPNWVLGNHDQPRIASRVGAAQARVAAMLLLTLRGTPTLYYGDEIGMQQVADPARTRCRIRSRRTSGHRRRPRRLRTPMQWDAAPNAGFSTGNRGCRWRTIMCNENVAILPPTANRSSACIAR